MSKTQNTAAKTADRQPSVARFGKLTKVKKLTTKKGAPYVAIELDCKAFKLEAATFSPAIMDRVVAAGEGAKVFMRVVMEEVKKSNGNGGTVTEDRAKIVFFKDNSAKADDAADGTAAAAEGETAEAETDAQVEDQSVAQDAMEDEIPF